MSVRRWKHPKLETSQDQDCTTAEATAPIVLAESEVSEDRIVRMNDMTGAGWTTLGSFGNGKGQFDGPRGIFVDAAKRIYVADSLNSRIVQFNDMTGAGWTVLGTKGSGTNQFTNLHGIFLDAANRIYAAEARIVRINNMTGAGWTTFGTYGSETHQFNLNGVGVFVDAAGKIYAADSGNDRIVRMNDMTGAGWTTFGTYGPGIHPIDPNPRKPTRRRGASVMFFRLLMRSSRCWMLAYVN